MEWQPIHKAPKDKVLILLQGSMAFQGAWVETEWRPVILARDLSGWHVHGNAATIAPTHFLLLPALPAN